METFRLFRMKKKDYVIVFGVGSGLGASLVRKFLSEGLQVLAVARKETSLSNILADKKALNRLITSTADVTSSGDINRIFLDATSKWGEPNVVIYNAGAFMKTSINDATEKDFRKCWEANCLGGFLIGQKAAKLMVPRGSGTILFTGATASKRGASQFFNLSVGKAGLLMLAQSMARELSPKGIHIGHIIIDGQIRSSRYSQLESKRPPDGLIDPDAIADLYWQIYKQPRSAWTLETEIRPWVEKF